MSPIKKQKTIKKDSKKKQISYEEISEKKTSKLGYLLLIIMGVFIIMVGEKVFSDLEGLPYEPIEQSYCISNSINDLDDLDYLHCPYDSGFNEIDRLFGLHSKFNRIKPKLQDIISFNKNIDLNESKIRELEGSIQELNENYDLSLQEKIAGETSILKKTEIKNEIVVLKSNVSMLKNEINSFAKQKNMIIASVSASVDNLRLFIDKADAYYETEYDWYKFKVFLLTLIFIIPLFFFSVYLYFRLKRKNSSYTIILAAITTSFSLLFLQVVVLFLYDILPKEWFRRIFDVLLKIPFMRYIIYYGLVLVVIFIFGGIVFFIQKKVFDPARVAIRRLKDKKCPACSFRLDSHHLFCPDCGIKLKEKCKSCGELKIKYLSHCPNCGK